MKKNAIALMAFALLSSISLGFSYVNTQANQKLGTTVSVVPDFDKLKLEEQCMIERNNKYLAIWN